MTRHDKGSLVNHKGPCQSGWYCQADILKGFFWHRLVGITLKVTDCKIGWCEPYIIENAGICIIVLTLYLMHPNYNKITLLLDLIVILVLHPLNFREWKVIQFPFSSRIPKDSGCKCVGMSTNLKRSSKTKMP